MNNVWGMGNSSSSDGGEKSVDEHGRAAEKVFLHVYNSDEFPLSNTPGFGVYHTGVEAHGAG